MGYNKAVINASGFNQTIMGDGAGYDGDVTIQGGSGGTRTSGDHEEILWS